MSYKKQQEKLTTKGEAIARMERKLLQQGRLQNSFVAPAKQKYFIKLLIQSLVEKLNQWVVLTLVFHKKSKLLKAKLGEVYCSKVNKGETLEQVLDREIRSMTGSTEYKMIKINDDGADFDRFGKEIIRYAILINVPFFETSGKRFQGLNGAHMSWIEVDSFKKQKQAAKKPPEIDNYYKLVNNIDAATYIRLLSKVGWFDCMSETRKKEKQETIKENFRMSKDKKDDAYSSLCDIFFDAEGVGEPEGENNTGYPQLLRELSMATDGVFEPLNISDEVNEDDTFCISFEIKGKRYEANVECSQWYDEEFIDTVNAALEELGAKQRFIGLPIVDQSQAYYFVPKNVYDLALKKNIIPRLPR